MLGEPKEQQTHTLDGGFDTFTTTAAQHRMLCQPFPSVSVDLPSSSRCVQGSGATNSVVLSHQLNIWRYGDFRADDADEFGYRR